ncbi:MAG: thiol:disulfide interchange protein, partial [Gallionellaceae bacterium]|nr:thiol:disulfide interchange protein [Gallionellaceae bacterium]
MRFLLLLLFCLAAPLAQAGLFDNLLGGSKEPTFLPPDEAFGLEVRVQDDRTLLADFRVTPDYYLYRDKISFTITDPGVTVTDVALPRGDMKRDPNFDNAEMEVFHQSFQANIRLDRSAKDAQNITVQATYQGCSEKGLCYLPIRKSYAIALPALTSDAPPPLAASPAATVPDNENSRIANLFKEGNFWLIISFFFGAGLLLAFTPCVFPMIPILSGIIVGRGHTITHMHGFLLSLAYVLGMAITYAAVGVA